VARLRHHMCEHPREWPSQRQSCRRERRSPVTDRLPAHREPKAGASLGRLEGDSNMDRRPLDHPHPEYPIRFVLDDLDQGDQRLAARRAMHLPDPRPKPDPAGLPRAPPRPCSSANWRASSHPRRRRTHPPANAQSRAATPRRAPASTAAPANGRRREELHW
jgi:hypothetical protein